MSSSGSVSQWLGRLQAGDPDAAQKLWERYFQRLVGLAHKKLQGLPRRASDEEDVALSVFASFCRGAQSGRFPQLLDRDNLWAVLIVLTTRKALNVQRDARRQKRGGGNVLGESALMETPDSSDEQAGLAAVLGREPTPEFAVQVSEQCERLLDLLGNTELRSIALWKMEGDTTEEVASKLQCAARTVERKLQRIRLIWEKELPA